LGLKLVKLLDETKSLGYCNLTLKFARLEKRA
jgi:hypothetical protein